MKLRKQRRKWKGKDMKKGIVTVLVCTGILCFSVPVEAITVEAGIAVDPAPETTADYDTFSNVWLDVIQVPTQAQISVTVPLSYGFVVIGSLGSNAAIPVSVGNGNLLLPNIRVAVTTPSGSSSGGGAEYEIQTVSQSSLPIRNYSTDVRDEDEDADAEEDVPPREGLPVEVRPYIVSIPMTKRDETFIPHHWEPVPDDPTWDGVDSTDAEAKFKKFQMLMDNLEFSVESTQYLVDTDDVGSNWPVIRLEDKIALDAPPDVSEYGYTSAGTAQVPSEKYVSVQVKVGGMQNQYKQVEESVKAGVIYWEIIPGELPPVTTP